MVSEYNREEVIALDWGGERREPWSFKNSSWRGEFHEPKIPSKAGLAELAPPGHVLSQHCFEVLRERTLRAPVDHIYDEQSHHREAAKDFADGPRQQTNRRTQAGAA